MTALTIRLRTDGDRIAVERWKDAPGTRTASRAIVPAIREWPDLVDEFAAERRTVEDLPLPVETFVAWRAGPGLDEDTLRACLDEGVRARPEMARVPISGTEIRASQSSRPYAGSPRGANAEASPSIRSSRWWPRPVPRS